MPSTKVTHTKIAIDDPSDDRIGEVDALRCRPRGAFAGLVLAHGAGAGMDHPFMEAVSAGLATRGVATLRYQFPYMHAGRRRPDPRTRLVATVGAAIAFGRRTFRGLPLVAGGKSMGGRMTSRWAASTGGAGVEGLVFLGFPLHPSGKRGTERAEHLREVAQPMLFVQGTRDDLAELTLVRRVCETLGRRAALHVVDGADHGFHVLRRSGRTNEEAMAELVTCAADWIARRCAQ